MLNGQPEARRPAIFFHGAFSDGDRERILHSRPLEQPPSATVVMGGIVPSARIVAPAPQLTYLGGAYTSRGGLVEESRLTRWTARGVYHLTLPYEVLPAGQVERVPTAVFGGFLFKHFGHMMLESMARLWWSTANDFRGPVLFQTQMSGALPRHVEELLQLAGLRDQCRLVTGNAVVQADELIVPWAAIELRSRLRPGFLAPFERIAANVAERPAPRRIFVTRGSDPSIRQVEGEARIAEELARAGFVAIDPTAMTIAEQVAVFRSAHDVVGLLGSAMHNLVYSRDLRRVAYIDRGRSFHGTYPLIDAVLPPHETHHVSAPVAKRRDVVDAVTACRMLAEAGFR